MFKIMAAIYITVFSAYACADKGFLVGISVAIFIGVPCAIGWAIGRDLK